MNQKEIAKILGLSEATVSLALRDNEKINHETREKVKHLAQLAGYRPNLTAQALAMGKTKCVGMIITNMTHPFYADMTQKIYNILQKKDYLLLCFPSCNQEMISRSIESLLSRNVDAIIYAGLELPPEEIMKIKKSSTPLIRFDNIRSDDIDSVFVDMKEAGRLLAEHMISQGFSKFAFIGMPSENERRLNSFRNVMAEHHIPFNNSWTRYGSGSFKEGYEMTMEILKEDNLPDAVICHNDIKAVGALRAVIGAGYKVPEQIAVASFDNIDFSEYLPVPLTCIDINRKKIAEELTALAFRRIDGDSSPAYKIRLEPELVIRDSTCRKN